MKISAIPFFLVTTILFSCGGAPPEGYSESESGLFYKLHSIGDGEARIKPGDHIYVRILACTETDSVIYETSRMGPDGAIYYEIDPPKYDKDFNEGFLMLSEGDSATFITDAHTLFNKFFEEGVPAGLEVGSPVFIHVKVLKILTAGQFSAWKIEQEALSDKGEFEEKKRLDEFIAAQADTLLPFQNGMYRRTLDPGDSVAAVSGKKLLIRYKGSFLNGRVFDATPEGESFEYTIGTEGQLIDGMIAAVLSMRQGEKAKFIIPSHLAFGSTGSSSGMVPPFTTVIYEVELLKVQ